MAWALIVVAVLAVLLLAGFLLNRFFVKASPETALVRTGWGGQLVVVNGGCLALPILHRVEQVGLRTNRLEIELTGRSALITAERLRADAAMAFYVRVEPTPEGVLAAAQSFGARGIRGDELLALLRGKLVGATQAAAAMVSMDAIHANRNSFTETVAASLRETLARLGLMLESASLVQFNQAPVSAFDDATMFDADGLRFLAESVGESRKRRAEAEAQSDIAIRRTHVDQARQRLALEQQQRELEIAQRQSLDELQARSSAALIQAQAQAEREAEQARIAREGAIRRAEMERDSDLRRHEMAMGLALESEKIDNAITLAAKRGAESDALAEAELRRAAVALATEDVLRRTQVAVAERQREIAVLKARETAEVEQTVVKRDVDALIARARAEAAATGSRAEADRLRMEAEAMGQAALAKAENSLSEQSVRLRLETHRLDRMPDIIAQLVKPAEKIESIRINQFSGIGMGGHGGTVGETGASGSPFNQALDSIMGMAVQFPALKRIGDEIGLEMDASLATRAADSIGRTLPKKGS